MEQQTSITTYYRRKKLTEITSGAVSSIPAITHMAFGSGGVDSNGNIIVPTEDQEALNNEFCRYPVEVVTYPVETTARYTAVVPRGEQSGQSFSEMALVDSSGKVCAIKNMLVKQKDSDVIFTFDFDDEF